MVIQVYLAGEGASELGSWAKEPQYREPLEAGVLETLFRHIQREGWSVREGKRWKDIRKFRSGQHRQEETRNVLGLALEAKEKGCELLVFTRDEDRNPQRSSDVEAGVSEALELFPSLKIAGGMAKPCLEAWVLALDGVTGTESLASAKAKAAFETHSSGTRMADFVEHLPAPLGGKIPADAPGLKQWLERVEKALGAVASAAP